MNSFRWLVVTMVALGALPGCPLTDHYSIQGPSAGAAQFAMSGGASEPSTAGTLVTAGRLDAGGNAASDDPGGAPNMDAGSPNYETGGTSAGGRNVGGAGAGHAGAGAGGLSAGGAGAGGARAGGAGTGGTAANAGETTVGGAAAGGGDSAGAPSNLPQPACADGVIKGNSCTQTSVQFCYKSCGPDNLGYKSETCQGGLYAELQMPACIFPAAQDYGCYKIPPSLPAGCPLATVPRAGQLCQTAGCNVCFGGSLSLPQYQDSTGAQKQGYCVCADNGTWTCASSPSWPCPGAQGCN